VSLIQENTASAQLAALMKAMNLKGLNFVAGTRSLQLQAPGHRLPERIPCKPVRSD
jgi:hypothetical protein